MESRQYVEETIEQIKLFLPQLIHASEAVIEVLYETMTDQTWQQFGELVEGLDDLFKALTSIDTEIEELEHFDVLKASINVVINSLPEKFQAMNASMDGEDFITASDYIRYELTPLIQQLAIELGDTKEISAQRYAANMTFLQQKYPKLHMQLSKVVIEKNHYQQAYARNGLPNLCMVTDGETPIYLYSQYDPAFATERWAKSLAEKVEHKSEIIMFGLGLGYHARSYAKLYPTQKLSIYEPDEQLLLAAMSIIDLKELFDQLNITDFVVGPSKSDRDKLFFRFLKFMKGDPEIISIPIYDRITNVDVTEFSKDAQTAILNYDSTVRMYEKYGMEWATNSMYNLGKTLTTPSILHLKNKFEGMTAVIAGAGPSLEADIECLRKLKNHAIIIAAGSTIQSLLHFGIEPHLIVSMDGSEANYNAFKGLDIQHIPLLFTPMLKYRILDEKNENLCHVHFINDSPTIHFMGLKEPDPIFNSNHSVTGTAIQAAVYLGCNEIVFTGQDLSYPNENTYSPGARHMSKQRNEIVINAIKAMGVTVENVQGTQNQTSHAMSLTLLDIENMTLKFASDARFINTTQMGAKIKHTEWNTMEEVLLRLQGKSLEDTIFIKELQQATGYEENRVNKIRTHIAQLPNEMLLNEKRLKRIDDTIGKLSGLSRTNQKKCYEMFNLIDTEWKAIIHSSPFKAFYFMIFKNDLNRFERDLPELATEQNVVIKSKLIQEIMQPLIQKLISYSPQLFEVVKEAKRRVEESINSSQQVYK